jgi:hypothetical protein
MALVRHHARLSPTVSIVLDPYTGSLCHQKCGWCRENDVERANELPTPSTLLMTKTTWGVYGSSPIDTAGDRAYQRVVHSAQLSVSPRGDGGTAFDSGRPRKPRIYLTGFSDRRAGYITETSTNPTPSGFHQHIFFRNPLFRTIFRSTSHTKTKPGRYWCLGVTLASRCERENSRVLLHEDARVKCQQLSHTPICPDFQNWNKQLGKARKPRFKHMSLAKPFQVNHRLFY